ncbi:unnamed protein product [Cercopithifilaria johnstoni]|uniref:Uncharacterized protein n=1 Tax=Cercopithifilaria johnstoni TaxID=2874296 RepID=A0A8J2M1C4_9BILA|nr:unnamed protein product [Cercopithifilaria johnstoni]
MQGIVAYCYTMLFLYAFRFCSICLHASAFMCLSVLVCVCVRNAIASIASAICMRAATAYRSNHGNRWAICEECSDGSTSSAVPAVAIGACGVIYSFS